ncbi:MAG TPA: TRAP transporter small permease [Tistrella mobilis]|jgi:TRAP-type C4-dicarboxylate transport system permease small subunit|nr:TRAP transporter small permease [Tistrella mobilis]
MGDRAMQALGRGLSRLIHFTSVIGVLAVTLMMLHITADVVVRNLFGIALPGTIAAVSNFYMLVVAFLPLAYAEEGDKHISVEVVTDLLPARAQAVLRGFAYVLSAAVFIAMTRQSWLEAMKKQAVGAFVIQEGWRIPIWPSYYILPVGTALMALVVLYRLATHVTGAASGLRDDTPDDVVVGGKDHG